MPTSPLASLMKRSPFKALQEHMRAVHLCIENVAPLFQALTDGDAGRVRELKESIFEREAAADAIKNDLRANLPRSLFMPVDRRDLLEILQLQDTIADSAQDIAGLLIERPMTVPEPLKEPLTKLVARCVETCDHALKIVEELDELVETGFAGKQAEYVQSMLDELNHIEDETDDMGLEAARILFQNEDEIGAVSVMMWYQIIQWIGDLADYSEKVGDRLRLLIAR